MAETALNVVDNMFFRTAVGTNSSILVSYVALPDVEFLAVVPSSAVGFQTFLVPLFTSLVSRRLFEPPGRGKWCYCR